MELSRQEWKREIEKKGPGGTKVRTDSRGGVIKVCTNHGRRSVYLVYEHVLQFLNKIRWNRLNQQQPQQQPERQREQRPRRRPW